MDEDDTRIGAPSSHAAGSAAAHAQPSTAVPVAASHNQAEGIDPGYIQMFIMRHVCPNEDCGGTMAPAAVGSNTCVCNLCGQQRTDAEFMAELNSMEDDSEEDAVDIDN